MRMIGALLIVLLVSTLVTFLATFAYGLIGYDKERAFRLGMWASGFVAGMMVCEMKWLGGRRQGKHEKPRSG